MATMKKPTHVQSVPITKQAFVEMKKNLEVLLVMFQPVFLAMIV